jgi:hypothetical protein
VEQWEYGILEWLWDASRIRLNLPGERETQSTGSYAEVVALLTTLGANGWNVAACVASSNWVLWTLKRQA